MKTPNSDFNNVKLSTSFWFDFREKIGSQSQTWSQISLNVYKESDTWFKYLFYIPVKGKGTILWTKCIIFNKPVWDTRKQQINV